MPTGSTAAGLPVPERRPAAYRCSSRQKPNAWRSWIVSDRGSCFDPSSDADPRPGPGAPSLPLGPSVPLVTRTSHPAVMMPTLRPRRTVRARPRGAVCPRKDTSMTTRRSIWSVLAAASLAVSLASCGDAPAADTPASHAASPAGASVTLQGAGASFPAPLYNKWFKAYSAAHQNVLVDYQSVGSGSGIKSVIDHTVDFGASDAAMNREDMAEVPEGVQLSPIAAGAIGVRSNGQA